MRNRIFAVLVMLVCSGCASHRMMTYQTTVMEEVEETRPSKEVVVQADIPQRFPGAKKGRKYLNIGFNPVNPNRVLTGEEIEFILPMDADVITIDRNNRRSRGWLLAGERVIGIPTNNPDYYKAVWIRRCGNPILNDDRIAIFIRVRRETVAQPSVKTYRPRVETKTVAQTCGKKSGLGASIGEAVFGLASLFIPVPASVRPYLSGGAVAVGSLTGAAIEGGGIDCIETSDLIRAGLTGTLAGALSAATTHSTSGGTTTGTPGGPNPPHPLPPNGPAVPGHTLPVN